jgi:hypothetical protein
MTLEEIKAAIDAGQTVLWANTGYRVHKDRFGQYLITFEPNGSSIGLTDRSGQRLNGDEESSSSRDRRRATRIPRTAI